MAEGDITRELLAARQGDRRAFDRLFELVYERLKNLARRHVAGTSAPATLSATVLVHEAYVKLVDHTAADWQDRRHFFAVAARAMRQIVVDHVRGRGALKRGGGALAVSLRDDVAGAAPALDDVIAVDAALERLADFSPRLVQIVEFCFFAGLTTEETGEILGVSARTIKRDWRKAKALLHELIRGEAGSA